MWWDRFVHGREDMTGIDSAIIMNSRVWDRSGHVETFSDPLVECKKCHQRFRADTLFRGEEIKNRSSDSTWACSNCGEFNGAIVSRQFNLLFRTFVGPVEDTASRTYLRPETAQGMFVNFKNVADTTRRKLPFGIAQIGKAFRNEITPRDFVFRSREFEQMEIEYFVREPAWREAFDMWLAEMRRWMTDIGVRTEHVHELEVPADELAHYSKRTVDFEYDFPFGRKELYGLAYRTDFDLKNHFAEPPYREEGAEPMYPHVIEPTWGVDRTALVVLLEAYREEDNANGTRVVLALPPRLAPYRAAVFPLLANKPDLVDRARRVYTALKRIVPTAWDDRGNIGKRYWAQDEIGTPSCITIDFQTLEDGTVTVRDRDTAGQERVSADALDNYFTPKIA
jgi:glycyl-tRNA synthetase